MFNDRLEIANPGGLYGDLTVDKLDDITNPPVRNRNLIRILEELEEIENRSSGIATMISSMRELRLEPPVFEDKRTDFTVTFKNHNLMTKQDVEWLKSINIKLTDNEAYALLFIRNNGKIANGDYQMINKVNRDKALQEIKTLISRDIIKSKGVGSGTYYIISGKYKKDFDISNNSEKSNENNPELNGDNPELSGDNPELNGDNPELSGDNPELSGDDPELSGDDPELNGDNPELNENNPELIVEEELINIIKGTKLNINEIKVIKYIYKNERINNKIATEITDLKSEGVKSMFRKLMKVGIVNRYGKTKGTYYTLNLNS